MPMRMSRTRWSICWIGWMRPWFCLRPGSVASTHSRANWDWSSSSLTRERLCSQWSASSSFNSLITLPRCGRSSGVQFLSSTMRLATGPFLPRYLTLMDSKSLELAAVFSSSRNWNRSFSISSKSFIGSAKLERAAVKDCSHGYTLRSEFLFRHLRDNGECARIANCKFRENFAVERTA